MINYTANGWEYEDEYSDEVEEYEGSEYCYYWTWCTKTFTRPIPDDDDFEDDYGCSEPEVIITVASRPIPQVYNESEDCWEGCGDRLDLDEWEYGIQIATPDGKHAQRWGSSGLNALKHKLYDLAGNYEFDEAVSIIDTFMLLEGWT